MKLNKLSQNLISRLTQMNMKVSTLNIERHITYMDSITAKLHVMHYWNVLKAKKNL